MCSLLCLFAPTLVGIDMNKTKITFDRKCIKHRARIRYAISTYKFSNGTVGFIVFYDFKTKTKHLIVAAKTIDQWRKTQYTSWVFPDVRSINEQTIVIVGRVVSFDTNAMITIGYCEGVG